MSEEFGVREELSRKSIDFLINLVHKFETGKISPETAVAQAKAVWHITSGLVESEVTDLAQRVADETAHKLDSKSIYFHHPDGSVARIKYPLDAPGLSLLLRTPKLPFREPKTVEVSIEDRPARIAALVKTLAQEGYHLI